MRKLYVALCLTIFFFASLILPASAEKNKETPILTFPVISDIHVESSSTQSQYKFQQALNDLHSIDPDSEVLIMNGDLTNGSSADFDTLDHILEEAPHPNKILSTIGNHEFYSSWFDADGSWNETAFPNDETEAASINRFLQFSGTSSVYSEHQINGYSFILLGSEEYRQSDSANQEDAYLSDTQLQWLKQTLDKRTGEKKPVFVFLHQPLPYTVSGTSFCCSNNRAIVQHEELQNLLSNYPEVIFFSGHTHWELKLPQTFVQDRFAMVNSSSVFQPWTDDGSGGETVLAPEASEGLYVEVYENKVVIQGRDFYNKRWIPEAQFTIPFENRAD